MQVLALVVAFIVLVVFLVTPLLAKGATTTGAQNTVVQPGMIRAWPSKYKGAMLQVKFSEALVTAPGFPAMDAASKDAAKMTISWQPESLLDFASHCADVVVRAATPTGVAAEAHPTADGNDCVALMKVPADTPLTVQFDFSRANGWIQEVEGGHATSEIHEKVGPDHIMHKHIAGVKWQDVIVAAGRTGNVKLLVYSYTPQLPATRLP